MEFKEGMRVEYIRDDSTLTGVQGTVVHVEGTTLSSIGVEWDVSRDSFHDCNGRAKNKHGWYVQIESIKATEQRNTPAPRSARQPSTLKLEDLTVALPLIGLRVMLNPEVYNRFDPKYHNVSGTIVSSGGEDRSVLRIIRDYKNEGILNDWNVRVTFDGRTDRTLMKLKNLIPIANAHKTVHVFKLSDGGKYTWLDEEYKEKLNEHVIMYGYNVLDYKLFDDKYRQLLLDQA